MNSDIFCSQEECDNFESQNKVREMQSWPSSESMQVIADTLIIKIGDITEGEDK